MLSWRFIAPNADLGQELSAAHSPFLVALSFFVAALGGYAALEVVERMASAPSPQTRRRWLAAGAAAMGSGIWSMHFIGMLAFSLPVPVSYDLTITLLSMVPAVFAGSRRRPADSPSAGEETVASHPRPPPTDRPGPLGLGLFPPCRVVFWPPCRSSASASFTLRRDDRRIPEPSHPRRAL